jgi:hypothetical protein
MRCYFGRVDFMPRGTARTDLTESSCIVASGARIGARSSPRGRSASGIYSDGRMFSTDESPDLAWAVAGAGAAGASDDERGLN